MFTLVFLLVCAVLLVLLHCIASRRVNQARMTRRIDKLTFEHLSGERTDIPEWQVWLEGLSGPLATQAERARLSKRMLGAGYLKSWHLSAFLLIKFVLFLLALVVGYIWFDIHLFAIHHHPFDALKYLFLVFLVARAPDWWLSGEIRKRQANIRSSVPHAMDLLTICVEAGVNLEESFGRVANEMAARYPEIASEFKLTRSEMLVMDRSRALRRMEKRSGVKELESLGGSLLQSINYGTPIAEALHTIAGESRARQIAELEEKAGSMSARIGIPLVVLVLLPLVGLIVAPAVINLARAF